MLNRTKFLYATLVIVLVICLFKDAVRPNKDISYLACAYFFIFLALALYLILRGFSYKIDTNIYFGITLLISPSTQVLIKYELFSLASFFVCCFVFLTLASLIIWQYFKDKTHKFIFFVFLGEILIFLTPFCLTNFSIWYLILIAIVWLISSMLFIILKKKFRKR